VTALLDVDELAKLVQPGDWSTIPADYSGVSIAATRALIAALCLIGSRVAAKE